ncbi:MAG: response regulator [Campylobacterota bacterium]|nr:response regulator [Campylobacterota bacterium]
MYENLEDISILVVDDDELMSELISNLLEDKVKTIYKAKDGIDGLEKYKELNPDLVITDYKMPNLNGLEMSKAIKDINNEQIIILITGFDNEEILKNSISIGINGLVSKPIVDVESLYGVVDQKAKVIKNTKELKSLKKFQEEKEKIYLVFDTVKSLSEQLKAPMNLVSSVSTLLLNMTKGNGRYGIETKSKIEDSLQVAEVLKYKLEKLENIDIENTSLEEIQRIVHLETLED